jgi:hypothetical protein
VLQGDIAALPLYICFIMQVGAAPVVNAIQSAYGIFYDIAFAGFWIAIAISRPRKAGGAADGVTQRASSSYKPTLYRRYWRWLNRP